VPRESLRTKAPPGRFVEPPWRSPLDPDQALHYIPQDAEISGMFIAPLLTELKRCNASIIPPRKRYVSFQFYPLREHAQLLIEIAERMFIDRPLRQALRKMGRAAPASFISSTLGKVVLGSSQGVHGAVEALAKAYGLNMRPGSASIVESQPNRIVVRLEEVHYFLDCHHVGAFEGAMNHAGVRGRVLIDPLSRSSADLLLQW
jgi:uncharacterized protein (TIGR02265 family)